MQKNLLLFLLILFISHANSQNSKTFLNNTVWLKGNKNIDTNSIARTSNKVLLNFHEPFNFKKSGTPQKFISKVNKKSSVFVVFKSESDTETNVITLDNKTVKAEFTTLKVITEKEERLNKTDPKLGGLVSHIFNRQSLSNRKGALYIADEFYTDSEGENQFYELLYIPLCLNDLDKNIAETYLSIKYGISLTGDKSYIDTAGDTIWEFKSNKNFNTRVTGIGRDDKSDLYQKQSGNSANDGLYIGLGKIKKLNSANKSVIGDKTFILWGDNNQDTEFAEKDNGFVKMGRIWRTQKTANERQINTQIIIDKKQMRIKRDNLKDNFIWLVIDSTSAETIDYSKAKFIKSTAENDSLIYFDNVNWSSKNALFTFIIGPEFIVNYSLSPSACDINSDGGKAEISINGGVSPYTVRVYSSKFIKEVTTEKSALIIDNLGTDTYSINVTDAGKRIYEDDFVIDPFIEYNISLAKEWFLDETGTVTVTPQYSIISEDVEFQWLKDGKIIYKGKVLSVSEIGDYILVVSNGSGCIKEFPFIIKSPESGSGDSFAVYPNPTKSNESFIITGKTADPAKTSIMITDLNGKVVLAKDIGIVDNFSYSNQLSQAATYIVIITSGDNKYTKKLIIK